MFQRIMGLAKTLYPSHKVLADNHCFCFPSKFQSLHIAPQQRTPMRHVGLVAKAFASRAADPGFDSMDIFPGRVKLVT